MNGTEEFLGEKKNLKLGERIFWNWEVSKSLCASALGWEVGKNHVIPFLSYCPARRGGGRPTVNCTRNQSQELA